MAFKGNNKVKNREAQKYKIRKHEQKNQKPKNFQPPEYIKKVPVKRELKIPGAVQTIYDRPDIQYAPEYKYTPKVYKKKPNQALNSQEFRSVKIEPIPKRAEVVFKKHEKRTQFLKFQRKNDHSVKKTFHQKFLNFLMRRV